MECGYAGGDGAEIAFSPGVGFSVDERSNYRTDRALATRMLILLC